MPYWGNLPWENDAAADWFASVLEPARIGRHVVEALNLDPVESPEKVRAAIAMVLMIGFPHILIDTDLPMLIEQSIGQANVLCRIAAEGENFALEKLLRDEVRTLRRRARLLAEPTIGLADSPELWRSVVLARN